MRKYFCLALLLLAMALYGVSFFLPVCDALAFGGGADRGWAAFALCFMTPFEGELLEKPDQFYFVAAWLANPAAWFGFVGWLLGKRRAAFLAGFTALALATPLQVMCVWDSPDPARELFGVGYWVWLASFVALVVASLGAMATEESVNP